jgi:HEXXH motif-containing protein
VAEHAEQAIARHRLPMAAFASLATGSGSPEVTKYLWSTERSRRLLLLSTVLREVDRDPSLQENLPPTANTWRVLAAAQAAGPTEFNEVILHPQVGSWAAYALRLHRGGASSDLPPWTEFGGINAVALVAAARTRLSWSTRIPTRAGHVMLPTLGMAHFPGIAPSSMIEATTENGVIYLRGDDHEVVVTTHSSGDGNHWWSLRRVTVGDDIRLTVWLDDLDPFRDLADPVPPLRLDQASFERWQVLLRDAWALLCRDHRAEAEAIAGGVVSLVPLLPDPEWDTRSASNGEAFGSVMVSEPPDTTTLAVALVHEYQHIKLGALIHLLRLTNDDDGAVYYAPWRDDPRPLAGLMQGIYAFFGIARFWRRHRMTTCGLDAQVADLEYAYARTQAAEAVAIAGAAPALTRAGQSLIDGLTAGLATWSEDSVSEEMTRLARLIAGSHRSAWRLRHFRPDSGQARRMAQAWLAGDAVESALPPDVVPHPDVRWPPRILALARRRVFPGNAQSVDGAPAAIDTLTSAEEALVKGDIEGASIAYSKSLASASRASEDEIRAWVGIALVAAEQRHPDAAKALRERPDLVRAVHGELTAMGAAVDPGDVAAWLAPAIAATA